jgi:hypothetical protein
MKPGSAPVPKMPGVNKAPKVHPIKSESRLRTKVASSTRGGGQEPVHPKQTKHNTGSAANVPKPSSGGQSGAYGLYKKYSY